MQLFARLYGTNNVNNCSYYCHQASGVALRGALGTSTATITLDDLKHCDLFFLIGGNPASNHPRLMTEMMNLRRRGGHVVVINPLKETGLVNFSVPSRPMSLLFGQEIASHYVQPHIGGDIAFLTGIAKRLFEMRPDPSFDQDFTSQHVEDAGPSLSGLGALRSHVESIDWDVIERESGVDGAEIDEIADLYAASERAVFSWTMGITHHVHGVDNVRAIINLALLRGMIGKPGAGLLPIRGHSNVQGIGSIGFTPTLARQILERIQQHFGVTLPTTPGMDTLACIEAMQRGELKSAWCLGGNLFGSNPDAEYCSDAFANLESCVYLSTTLNTGHAHGRAKETLILPVRARDEEAQPTTQESMFNYVRLSDGGPPRLPGPRGEVEIIAHWAQHALAGKTPIDWRELERHCNIRKAIAATVPGYEKLADIDATKQEFQIAGRTFHEPKFKTESGKARFHAVPIPSRSPETGPSLRLMTIRSEGQFNTVVYEDEDLYRNQDRRDVILMNPEDIERLGLRADWRVTVRSSVGEMKNILVRPFDIRAGNAAMYYPEANILVPRIADPESRTPAFKAVSVTVVAQQAERKSVPLAVVGYA